MKGSLLFYSIKLFYIIVYSLVAHFTILVLEKYSQLSSVCATIRKSIPFSYTFYGTFDK